MKVLKTSQGPAVAGLLSYLVLLGIIVFAARLTDLGLPQMAEGILQLLHAHNFALGIRFGHVEAAANVLLFVPVGLLVALMLPRRLWWLAVVAGIGMSLSIELVQAAALSGRSGTSRDVVCNSLGAFSGSILAVIVSLRSNRRRSHLVGASA